MPAIKRACAQGDKGRSDQLPGVRRSVSSGRARHGQVAMARLILWLAVRRRTTAWHCSGSSLCEVFRGVGTGCAEGLATGCSQPFVCRDNLENNKMSTHLSTDQLLHAYTVMRTIRDFEERLHVEFATGEIPGFVHLYAGQEASAAGVMAHLNDEDCIASNHRGHGHCIAKGVDVFGMMAEIYGKMIPLPGDRLIEGLDGVTSIDTPGHAPYHNSYVYAASGCRILFPGEAAGVFLPKGLAYPDGASAGFPYIRPATPPKFFFDVTLESLKKVEAVDAEWICYPHFGPSHEPETSCAFMKATLSV